MRSNRLPLQSRPPKVTFVTNLCPHYRVRTFELFARQYDTVFFFFSPGNEWYWQQKHGTRTGAFRYEYLKGLTIFGTRIVPGLFTKLLRSGADVYIKCINGRLALPLAYLAARLRRKPFILWTGIWMRLDTPFHRLMHPVTRYFYRHSDAIVTYGVHVKNFLVREGVQSEKIFLASHAVDNGVYSRKVSDGELARLREQLDLQKDQTVVLYLGRMEHNKGLRHLINAFAALSPKKCILVLAGEGSERDNLEHQVQDLGIAEHVRFVNYVQPEDTPPYYALAAVCVLPSITTPTSKELWGLVVNEAMNQGCPVVVTDAVGAAAGGLVRDHFNGIVVPEANSAQLAIAIQEVLSNQALRHALGENARKTVSEWDNERMVNGFRSAIRYVTNGQFESNAELHLREEGTSSCL